MGTADVGNEDSGRSGFRLPAVGSDRRVSRRLWAAAAIFAIVALLLVVRWLLR